MGEKRLGTGERKILRICGTSGRARKWKVRTNQELRELYKDVEIVADIKKENLVWTGHVVSMEQGGID
jgi:hypothetical protein